MPPTVGVGVIAIGLGASKLALTQKRIHKEKARVSAADDEFHTATAFHETWKPAAYGLTWPGEVTYATLS